MCLVENLHEKAEDSRGFDLDASPILRSLISRSAKTLHRALWPRSTVLAEKGELFSVTPVQIRDSRLGCLQKGFFFLAIRCLDQEGLFFLAHYAEKFT